MKIIHYYSLLFIRVLSHLLGIVYRFAHGLAHADRGGGVLRGHLRAAHGGREEALGREVLDVREVHREPGLEASIGEGPNHSNFSDQSSARTLGIRNEP